MPWLGRGARTESGHERDRDEARKVHERKEELETDPRLKQRTCSERQKSPPRLRDDAPSSHSEIGFSTAPRRRGVASNFSELLGVDPRDRLAECVPG